MHLKVMLLWVIAKLGTRKKIRTTKLLINNLINLRKNSKKLLKITLLLNVSL